MAKPTLKKVAKKPVVGSSATKKLSIPKMLKLLGTATTLPTQGFLRPSFSSIKDTAARLEAYLATGIDYRNKNLSVEDLAAPHRIPYARLRDTVLNQPDPVVTQLTQSLCAASQHCEGAFLNISQSGFAAHYHALAGHYQSTRQNAENALHTYQQEMAGTNPFGQMHAKLTLINALNNLASNAPGLGPHSTDNAIVSDLLHIHPTGLPTESVSPRSLVATAEFPSEPVATTHNHTLGHNQVVSVTGALHTLALGAQPTQNVNVGTRVLRGALFVDQNQQVFRPKNPTQHPSGNFAADWERVV